MSNAMIKSSNLVKYYSSALEQYFDDTDSLIILILDENLSIKKYNQPFIKLIGSRGIFRKLRIEEIEGQSILNFIMPESQAIFETQYKQESDRSFFKTKLNFSVKASPSMNISCYIFKMENTTLIIGEQITLTDMNFMDKMSQLNSEMANMIREIQQKNREIQRKNRELEQKSIEIEQKNHELEQKNIALEQAYSEIKILTGIIPICMHCKEVRDDQGYWEQVENYISKHSDAQFSHGVCPKCMEKYYSEYM